ncbi:MAG: hypothetical protein WDM77_21180 [Steroidobacteraceae bacterium]
MPPANPGSLDARTATDIEAYLLRENGGRAGALPLLSTRMEAASAPQRGSTPQAAAPVRIGNEDATYHAIMAARAALLQRLTPVSDALLRNPPPADWLMWRGSYATLSYSPLSQINKNTVRELGVAWTLALPPQCQRGRAPDPRRRAVRRRRQHGGSPQRGRRQPAVALHPPPA